HVGPLADVRVLKRVEVDDVPTWLAAPLVRGARGLGRVEAREDLVATRGAHTLDSAPEGLGYTLALFDQGVLHLLVTTRGGVGNLLRRAPRGRHAFHFPLRPHLPEHG